MTKKQFIRLKKLVKEFAYWSSEYRVIGGMCREGMEFTEKAYRKAKKDLNAFYKTLEIKS